MAGISTYSELEVLVRARYSLLYVLSWEEGRVTAEVNDIASRLNKKVFSWSVTTGLWRYRNHMNPGKVEGMRGTKDPLVALKSVFEESDPSIFIFKDLHLHMKEAAIKRALRDLAAFLPSTLMTVIILAPTLQISTELEKDVTVVDYPLPGRDELGAAYQNICDDLEENEAFTLETRPEGRDLILEAAIGLTIKEAENVFAKTLVMTSRLTANEIPLIYTEKKQIIRKSGMLDYIETENSLDDVGGLENLKEWLSKRRDAFGEKARAYGLPAPRGVLFVGVQGCGKSLCAKAVSTNWRLPLLRLDAGAVFSKFVGESESNLRRVIQLAESISPVILWIDEIDKGFSGAGGGGSEDSGTSARVFGSFITWMQEKTSSVFVIATANKVEHLPAELLRKGRFDEIFFVDLPHEAEREAIFKIHLHNRKYKENAFDIGALVESSKSYSGAEIEQAIVSGMFDAFESETELTTEHVLQALRETFPLSQTMAEQIESRRRWAVGRARPASQKV
jgi:SpoVK/Ycf46/Vps4 family AAA+-type ATPase